MNGPGTPYGGVAKIALLVARGCPITLLDRAAGKLKGLLPETAMGVVAAVDAAISEACAEASIIGTSRPS